MTRWQHYAALLACAVAATAGTPAVAAPRPACRLVVDDAGDGKRGGTGRDTPAYSLLYNDPSLDIRSVDVATNPRAVAVALRLTGYERLDPTSPLGRMWVVILTVTGFRDPIFFQYQERAGTLPEASWGTISPGAFGLRMPAVHGPARAVVDQATAEIRIWLPTAYYRDILVDPYRTLVQLGGRGRSVTLLEAGSFRWAGDATDTLSRPNLPVATTLTNGVNDPSDDAGGAIRYAGGTPSCVPLAAPPARAGGRACELLRDLLGDTMTGVSALDPPHDDANLDLVSADVASNRTTLTGAIRLSDLEELDPVAPLGRAYLLEFDLVVVTRFGRGVLRTAPARYFLSYRDRSQGPPRAEWGSVIGGTRTVLGTAAGTLDLAGDEVRISVALNAGPLRGLGSRRVELGNLYAEAARFAGDPTGQVTDPTGGYVGFVLGGDLPYTVLDADVADSDTVYVGGAPSCLPVGR